MMMFHHDPLHSDAFLDQFDRKMPGYETLSDEIRELLAVTQERLQALPLGLIVMRMLNNLKAIYLKRSDMPRAIQVLEFVKDTLSRLGHAA